MRALTQDRLLHEWEAGAGQGPVVRAVALAAAAGGHTFAEASDLPLGTRDALLVDVRAACFPGDLECLARCPGCGEELDVSVPLSDLRLPVPERYEATLVTEGGTRVRYRALTSRDVLAVAPQAPDARRRLVGRCVLDVDGAPAAGEPADEVVEAVAAALTEADPRADVRLALTCALCGHAWAAPFDVPAHVWAEVDACARGLLAQVHALARAYGWSERDILALSSARRRFYLEAIGA
ncbi:T4 family baseplate hub assembly chaperone [Streptomyces sp. NPDC055815]